MAIRLSVLTVLLAFAAASPVRGEDSAFKTDATGWVELLASPDLGKDWQRVSFVATRPVVPQSPWSYDPATGILTCQGKGIHEMLLYRQPQADGIMHVEWRYPEVVEKANSGVFVRTSADGKYWHQAQLATSALGVLFGPTLVGGADKKVNFGEKLPALQRPPGEWNELEVTARGPEITLWINGKVTAQWKTCEIPQGCVGLESEFCPVEFRNVKFKPLPKSSGLPLR